LNACPQKWRGFVRVVSVSTTLLAMQVATVDLSQKIRTILKEHGRLGVDAIALSDDYDLYQAGLTSHASVNVMLALEGEFEIEFPDLMLKRGTFDSIASIEAAIATLLSS
jgi:acyl carrier protein